MNKNQLIKKVAHTVGLTHDTAAAAVNMIFNEIAATLERGEKVCISGFGTFDIKERAPRVGRNLGDNTPHYIPARRVPYFEPGKWLKAATVQPVGEQTAVS